MNNSAKIIGFQKECECLHCGRELKVGVVVEGFGVIGGDCLAKATSYQYAGKTHKYNRDTLVNFAIAISRGAEYFERSYASVKILSLNLNKQLTYA